MYNKFLTDLFVAITQRGMGLLNWNISEEAKILQECGGLFVKQVPPWHGRPAWCGAGGGKIVIVLFHYISSLSDWLVITTGNHKWIEQSKGWKKIRDKTGDHWLCDPGIVWGQQGAQWQRTWRHSRGGSHQVGRIYRLLDCTLKRINLSF